MSGVLLTRDLGSRVVYVRRTPTGFAVDVFRRWTTERGVFSSLFWRSYFYGDGAEARARRYALSWWHDEGSPE